MTEVIFKCPNLCIAQNCIMCAGLHGLAVYTVDEEDVIPCNSSRKPMIRIREYKGERLIDLWKNNFE